MFFFMVDGFSFKDKITVVLEKSTVQYYILGKPCLMTLLENTTLLLIPKFRSIL